MKCRFFFHMMTVVLLFAGMHCGNGVQKAEKIILIQNNKPVLEYQARFIPSPDEAAPWYGRSGFIHPVFTPEGKVVTSDFPPDHLHQHGIMFAWTSGRIGNRKVDFWNSQKKEARVEHIETVQMGKTSMMVKLKHIDLTTGAPVDVIHETWEIRLVGHEQMHVFDLKSTQTVVLDEPFHIDKYHYGSLCVRGADAWMSNKADMLTSEGFVRENGNHTTARWVALSGEIDGAVCGLAAMGHPDNFRTPQPVRLHPSMPYFSFTPMVTDGFELQPGEDYVSRFRFAAFDGSPDAGSLDRLWKDYAGLR
jgi:hypothetical protein